MTDQQPARSDSLQGKRLLVVATLFPPNNLGGAEMSAANLAQQLRQRGAIVGVLTTAKTPEEVCNGVEENGLKIWRVWIPRAYPAYYFAKAKWWQKPLWHLQDHFDPRNRKIVSRVLDAFKPDIINVHLIQGIGYNALHEFNKRGLPTIYSLHDLCYICIKTSMFRHGCECETQCLPCRLSCNYKKHCLGQGKNIGFCSPSKANLDKVGRYIPMGKWPTATIMNANSYPAATVPRERSDHFRILYAGRLAAPKGIGVLLEAVKPLAEKYPLSVTIAGSGPEEAALHETYGSLPWCHFVGFISQTELSNLMVNSDILCIPSVWAENSPGVVIQALGLGLPVIGSDIGGIPELIESGKNGLLVKAADVEDLRTALEHTLKDPSTLNQWKDYALENAEKFDADYLGKRIESFIASLLPRKKTDSAQAKTTP